MKVDARIRAADNHDDHAALAFVQQAIGDGRLQEVTMLVDPALKIERGQRRVRLEAHASGTSLSGL